MTPRKCSPHPLALAIALALDGPAAQAAIDCTVSVASDNGLGDTANTLSWAIVKANNGTSPNDPYPNGHPGGGCNNNTITLTTDVTVTGVMKRLIDSNVTLTSDATCRTISGNNAYRPLFVKSGTVTLQKLNLANGLAQGGASSWGGGGAGLGGALFVYQGRVTVRNVAFTGNQAKGGNSGGGVGGGGMFGNGATGGGGLFAASSGSNGGYGGLSGYGGWGGTSASPNGGFGGGGFGGYGGYYGCNGGFGGGGGGDNTGGFGCAGGGGFGGGGGFFDAGGGGGGNIFSYGYDGGGDGGGGAGFGGAIFVKRGTLTLRNVSFTGNSANRSTGFPDNGIGKGGAVFICTPDLDSDYTASGAKGGCAGSIDTAQSYGISYSGNTAADGNPDLFWTQQACGSGLPLTTGVGALWQQLALPCVPDSATVQGALGSGATGNLVAGNYDSGAPNYKNKTHWWRLFFYNAGDPTPGYVLPMLSDDVFTGTGYWLKSFDAPVGGGNLTVTGTATPTDVVQADGCAVAKCKAIGLYVAANRYNLVGNPFPYNVDWSMVRIRVGGAGGTVYTPSQAAGIGSGAANPAVLSKQIWIWNGTTYQTWDDDTNKGNLQYFKSFWVKVLPGAVGQTLELLIPAEASTLSQTNPADLPWLDGVAPPARAADGDWQVRLTVTNKVTGWKDTTNLLGQKATAKPGYDAHDLAELAPFATPYLSLVFPHPGWPAVNGQKRAGNYATDFRPAAGNRPMDWAFELRGSPRGGKVFITWQADPAVLKRCRLVDRRTGQTIDPTVPVYAQGYPVALKSSPQRYLWRYLGP